MTTETTKTVITPISYSPNSDALPVLNADTSRVTKYTIAPGATQVHIASDDTEILQTAHFFTGATEAVPVITYSRPLTEGTDEPWPLFSGKDFIGLVGPEKTITFENLSSAGTATLWIMEG